jgi:hypothetical protein
MVSKLLVFWNFPKKHARKLKMREKKLATKMGEISRGKFPKNLPALKKHAKKKLAKHRGDN